MFFKIHALLPVGISIDERALFVYVKKTTDGFASICGPALLCYLHCYVFVSPVKGFAL